MAEGTRAQTTFSLKDRLFNPESVAGLGARLAAAWPAFPRARFERDVVAAFPQLELKQRIAHITDVLEACLPAGYAEALDILLDALPPELDPERTDDDFGDFILAPLSRYVAMHGCTAMHLERSLGALREMTKRFSAEDAIRTFINAFPAETLSFLMTCAHDEHYHVRRLASEGTRPLLPWAQRLTIDPRSPIPILDVLHADRTRYVTRSVANHVNDIARIDAGLAVETVARWSEGGRQDVAEMRWVTEHALRTLARHGHAGALDVLGFAIKPGVEIDEVSTDTPRVRLGEAFRFSVRLRSKRRQSLLVDYALTFAAGRGRKPGRKVFRLKRLDVEAGEEVTLTKAHPFRPMTTRRLYPGEHHVAVHVNGRERARLAFHLELPA